MPLLNRAVGIIYTLTVRSWGGMHAASWSRRPQFDPYHARHFCKGHEFCMAIVHSAAFFAFARVFFCMALCARVNFILLACPEYLRAYWPCIRARIHGVLARFRATLGFCTRTINKTEPSLLASLLLVWATVLREHPRWSSISMLSLHWNMPEVFFLLFFFQSTVLSSSYELHEHGALVGFFDLSIA